MDKKDWRILTVVFAVIGSLLLIASYQSVLFPTDVKMIYCNREDGYLKDGEPTSPYEQTLIVAKNDSKIPYTATSFLYFKTSTLPDNADITSAVIKIKVKDVKNTLLAPFFILYDKERIHPHLPYISEDGEKSYYESSSAGVVTRGDIGKWKSYKIPTGWINKDGWTKLALFAVYQNHYIEFYSANSPYIPMLEVTYTIPKYHLTVKTNPTYCDVTVAGETKNSGTSGATFYLTEGTYKVTVSKEGYVTKTVSVSLYSDKTITVTLEPIVKEYTLTVYTTPSYCTVEVTDGDKWSANSGSDGKCLFILEEGHYYITVSKEGYKAETKEVTLNSNKAIYVTLEEEIKEYSLIVHVNVIGATVEVGGQTKIVPSTGFVEFTLEEGTYTVTVYKDGYDTITREINLNQNVELHISLTPQRPDVAITYYMNLIGLTMLLIAIPCGIKGWIL